MDLRAERPYRNSWFLGSRYPDLPAAALRDLIFGPAIYRLLMTGKPMNKAELAATFDATWRAIAAR